MKKLTGEEKMRAWKAVVGWAKDMSDVFKEPQEGNLVTAEFFSEDVEAILFVDKILKKINREKRKKQ